MDSVYVLAVSDNSKTLFQCESHGPPVCQAAGGQGCQFDYNNYAHNQASNDQQTGFIDLQKTMKNSLLDY
jgi:hypothetical protein